MSDFFLFLGVRAKEKGVEGGDDRTLGKATLPRRNRFVNLSWPGPLHPVPVCMLFTCLPKISFQSFSSHHVHRFHEAIEEFETKRSSERKRTERNVFALQPWLRAFNNKSIARASLRFFFLCFSLSRCTLSSTVVLFEIDSAIM